MPISLPKIPNSRSFRGLRAVDDFTLSIGRGEIVGIIGPNGSGKTTLLNLLTGIYPPDDGDIRICGASVVGWNCHDIAGLGLARSFQTPRTFDSLDTLQNCIVALQAIDHRPTLKNAVAQFRTPFSRWIAEATAVLKDVWHEEIPRVPAMALAYGSKRMLELARCMAARPQILILDEPTSGLSEEEALRLGRTLARLGKERGITMLVVDHKFSFLNEFCSRIVAMSAGRCIADGACDEVISHPAVIDAYFGVDD